MALTRNSSRSIRSQVLSVTFATIASLSVSLVVTVAAITFFSLRVERVRDAEMFASTLASVLEPLLANGDHAGAASVLKSWRTVDGIDGIALYSDSPRPSVTVLRTGADSSLPDKQALNIGTDVDWSRLRVVQSLTPNDSHGDVLYVTGSLAEVYQFTLNVVGVLLAMTLVVLLATRMVLRRLVTRALRPLRDLVVVAETIARSPIDSPLASETGPGEVRELAHTFNIMVETLRQKAVTLDQQLKELARTETQLDQLAHYDQVTMLANRVQFNKELPRAAERARRQGTNIAVVFLDLDDFKLVNDTLGHDFGDRLLQAAAERLTANLRKGDFVCRLGGDEFTLILEGITSLRTAVQVVSKLNDALAQPYEIEGHTLNVGASAGIALYPTQTEDLGDLLRFADIAMYQAKNAGKNDYCVFTSELVSRANDRLSIESDLRRGMEHGEFFLLYQPQIDIRSGRLTGLEALIRWQHPTLGLVSPDYFIDIAEKSGLIVPIGRQVISLACRQWQNWHQQGLEPPRIAVNVSGRQLHEGNFADELLAALAASGNPHPALELEITESLLLADTQVSKAMFHQLASAGIEWSLDDFGTGYSSLTYLAKFPIRSIKIDRSFIARVPGHENSEAIVKAIVAMARGLGMRVITEGVETRQQVEYLAAMSGIVAQGYYYHPPLEADAVGALLRRQKAIDTIEANTSLD